MRKTICTMVVLLGGLFQASAQNPSPLAPFPLAGEFYVSVDDDADIFLNGNKIHAARLGESHTPPVTLNVDDRVVVKLWNKKGPRRFALVFASTDRKSIIHFTHESMKMVDDLDLTDMKPREFQDLRKFAVLDHKGQVKTLGFNNHSEWIWGEGRHCTLAALIQRNMVKPLAP